MRSRGGGNQRRGSTLQPDWYDEFDVGAPTIDGGPIDPQNRDKGGRDVANHSQTLACSFLRVSRLQYGTFELLTRYETALWRQAAQLLFMLQSTTRS